MSNYSSYTSRTVRDRALILDILKAHPFGLDDHQIRSVARHQHGEYMTPSGARTRRAELVRGGFVREGVRKNISPTGRTVKTWVA